ncbi:MAG: tripartite tricarboxylate transporter TctB family protein, partial [Burkholderiales bacterium]
MSISRELRYRAAGSLAMAAIGCWAAWEGRKLGLFVLGTPAPGLFPFIFGVMLIAIALLCLVVDMVSMRRSAASTAPPADADPRGLLRVIGYLVVGVGFAIAMQWIGFVPAAFVGLLLLMRGCEGMPWRISLLTALGATLSAHLLFVRLL